MRFSITREQADGFDQVILRDHESGCDVAVLPANGAMLHAFTVKVAGGRLNVIDSYSNLAELQRDQLLSYKSSKLSPFVCRMRNGKYEFDGKHYEITKKYRDGNAIHGLIADKEFKVMNEFADDEKASVVLKYHYQQDDTGYPFEYRCEATYTLLSGNLLKVETLIINLNETSIPVADGWHPYFTLAAKTDDLLLQFNAESIVEFEDLVPTGRLIPYTSFNEERPIGDLFLDNSFMLKKGDGTAACTLYNNETKVCLSFFPDESYPVLQLFTPNHRKSIAIENLSGAPDCFNNKIALVILKPGESKTFTVYYQVETE